VSARNFFFAEAERPNVAPDGSDGAAAGETQATKRDDVEYRSWAPLATLTRSAMFRLIAAGSRC